MKQNEGIYLPKFDPNLKWVPVKTASDKTNLSEHILRGDLKLRKFGNKDHVEVAALMEYLERD